MPYDSGGLFSLVPSYKAIAGQTIRTEQHNPPLEDLASGMSSVLVRDGRAGMVGNLPMGGFKAVNMGDGTDPTDAATVGQIGAAYGSQVGSATSKATPVDADYLPLYDSAASSALRKLSWANIKATLKTYFDTLYQGTGTALLKAGGTMTGDLILKGDPSSDLMAVTKQYVDGHDFGVGQTWQDLSASRTPGTSYRNTTGKPIAVSIVGLSSGAAGRDVEVSSNNATWIRVGFQPAGGGNVQSEIIVPDTWYYRVNGALTAGYTWAELR